MTEAEIATFLAASGMGTLNTNVFYNEFPNDPDVALCVMGYGGNRDEPEGPVTRLEFPRFQVMFRGIREDSDGPQLRALQGRTILVAVMDQMLSGVHYASIDCLGPPFPQGKDDQFRHVWSVNFEAMKDPSSS